MATPLAWSLIVLGIAHLLFGVLRFNAPLRDALAAGFVGQFFAPEVRRTAFWFLAVGPMLLLAGHLALHAAPQGDRAVFTLIGAYLLPASLVGVVAFPKSPLWAPLVLAPLFLLCGAGVI